MPFHTEVLPVQYTQPMPYVPRLETPAFRPTGEALPARRTLRQRAASILGGFALLGLGAASSFVAAEAMSGQSINIIHPVVIEGHPEPAPFSVAEQHPNVLQPEQQLGSTPFDGEPPIQPQAQELPAAPGH